MGDEVAEWVSKFLKLDGCRMYYMAPHHKARVLQEDPRWSDITKPGEEVGSCVCIVRVGIISAS